MRDSPAAGSNPPSDANQTGNIVFDDIVLMSPDDGMTTQQAGAFLTRNMQRNDLSDLRRIDQVMRQYGYPGKSLVGTPANEAVFYVVQHAPLATINQYLPLIKQAAEKGELPFRLYAMMLDRQLMYQGHEQVYGTQGRSYTAKNPTTGQPEAKMLIWPIKDAAGVNERARFQINSTRYSARA